MVARRRNTGICLNRRSICHCRASRNPPYTNCASIPYPFEPIALMSFHHSHSYPGSLSQASSTNRRVRYSPNARNSFSFSTRNVSLG